MNVPTTVTIETPPPLLVSLRVGFFLAVKDILHSNIWTTILIIFVMTLTFSNIVVVRGILIGLVEGSSRVNRQLYSGDVIISNLDNKQDIQKSANIIDFARSLPVVKTITSRYITTGRIEAGYTTKKQQSDKLESTTGVVAGIDPVVENNVTGLGKFIVEGHYLDENDTDTILIGAGLTGKYTTRDSPGQQILQTVHIGSKVHLFINGYMREVTVKGIIKSKINAIDQRIFIQAKELKQLLRRYDNNVNEIVITIKPPTTPEQAKQYFINNDLDKEAKIQTFEEAKPQFVKDVETTFSILGNIIGTIALIVAFITIFIVIFVNAITRRKYIGILKGIGISSVAIELSYVFQSLFYAICGVTISIFIIYIFLIPYFSFHPINFPFSDGILVAPLGDVIIRAVILYLATILAGFIPSYIVVRQNTLDAILGR